jgi:hypothetical protein
LAYLHAEIASSDRMLQAKNCVPAHAVLGAAEGATLQRPGWASNNVGFYPFPTGEANERGERERRG